MRPAARLITAAEPRLYDPRNRSAVLHVPSANEGARLAAPSSDNPCNMPFTRMSERGISNSFFGGSDWDPAACACSVESMSPKAPIMTKLIPTAAGEYFASVAVHAASAANLVFSANAAAPRANVDNA